MNSTFQTSSYVVSKSPFKVWCCAGSNSHILKPRRWSLARENLADEHDLDYVDKLELLVHQLLDAGLESGQLLRIPSDPATLFPRGEPCRDAGSEFEGRCPIRVTRLGDVEPPRLPPLDGFHEGPFEPKDIGHLTQHGASALRLSALHYLRLDIEGLEPQAEVGLDVEEGLAHDDKRRDVEDEVRRQIMKI